MDTYLRLRQFDILSHFSNSQIEQIGECISVARHLGETKILEEGDSSRDLFLVDDGSIEIQRDTPYGVFSLASLAVGDLFGETSFVDDHARSGDAVARGETTLFTVHQASAFKVMEEDKRFALALYWTIWKSLSQKLRRTNETLAHFFTKAKMPPSQKELQSSPGEEFHVGVGAKRDLFREQKLSLMEINFLATLSKERKLAPGTYVFREGDQGDHMYIVLDGKVMISKEILGSGEEALAFLERGDYFGEMALIDNQPRSADAKTHEDGAVVLAIPREVLEGILDIQKVSSLRLLTILCNLVAKRLREIDDKLVSWYIFNAGSGESLQLP